MNRYNVFVKHNDSDALFHLELYDVPVEVIEEFLLENPDLAIDPSRLMITPREVVPEFEYRLVFKNRGLCPSIEIYSMEEINEQD